MTEYVRTIGGRVAHRPRCHYVRNAFSTPWDWAAGRPPQEIRSRMALLGLPPVHFCKRCIDLDGGGQ